MISWNESIKFQILKEDTSDAEVEIETDSEKNVYLYVKPINTEAGEEKREYLGTFSMDTLISVCNRAKEMWEEEVKTEDK